MKGDVVMDVVMVIGYIFMFWWHFRKGDKFRFCIDIRPITDTWVSRVLFDVVVLFHLFAIADKIYENHCAPWSVEMLIRYAFP